MINSKVESYVEKNFEWNFLGIRYHKKSKRHLEPKKNPSLVKIIMIYLIIIFCFFGVFLIIFKDDMENKYELILSFIKLIKYCLSVLN